MKEPAKTILIVEDEDDHYELVQRAFDDDGGTFCLVRALTLTEAHDRIGSRPPALVITDWKLPDGDGIELIRKKMPGVFRYPVIVMTSHGNEAWAVEAMRLGALDYIVKSPETFFNIPRLARRALKEWENITEREEAELALQEEKEFTETAINTMQGVFFVLDTHGRYVRWNKSFEALAGTADKALLGKDFSSVFRPEEQEGIKAKVTEVFAAGYAETEGRICAGGGDDVRCYYLTLRKMYSGGNSFLVGSGIDITERKQAEETIRQSREYINLILNSAAEGIYGMDQNGNCTFCNASGLRMLGYESEQDLLGKNIHELVHHSKENGQPFPHTECSSRKVFSTGNRIHAEREFLWQKNGKGFPVEYWAYPLTAGGKVHGAVCTFIDITERMTLEHQLRQSQKMEAIGVLAGGVSHDFNNILTAIIGYGNIIQRKMGKDDPMRTHLDQILTAANRATGLTRSLLAFSRKQIINPQKVDLNEILRRVERFLCRIIGEDIVLKIVLAAKPVNIIVDSTQIEQVVMNLSANARDAMPRGGILTIETGCEEFDDAQAVARGLARAGLYAVMTVTDTGIGIDDRTREKIFEPFFTTKETGKGTGLGLSIVYGILKQNNGHINVESEEGKGSRFRIYLPLAAAHQACSAAVVQQPLKGGNETILIAEDDQVVRTISREVLQEFGYSVIEAEDGEEAVSRFRENAHAVQLIILDVIMPKRSGREVFEEAKKIRPDVKVLFTSGYPVDLIRKEGVLEKGCHFLAKPSSPEEVLKKVRLVLDQETL